jgi:regulator of replication initiation timing
MKEIIKEFEELCSNLSISNDSPNEELIKEYFDRYAMSKQISLQKDVHQREMLWAMYKEGFDMATKSLISANKMVQDKKLQ